MHTPEPYDDLRRQGALLLSDLDLWVRDPASYEREREALVRFIVRSRLKLFPGEWFLAMSSRPALPGSEVSPTDLYSVYLREIRRIPTMERSEEFRFALALEIAKRTLEAEMAAPRPSEEELDAMVAAVDSHDPTFHRAVESLRRRRRVAPSTGVDAERVARVKERFEEMLAWKRVLVFRTLQLVPGMARKYKGMGVPLMDLIQEANTSLMKATDRYEWRKGVRFVVYARWWVQQGVLKSLSCQSRTVRTPVYLAQKLKKIRDLNEEAFVGTGRNLTAEQIGAKLDEPADRIRRALAAARMTVSIDRELDPTGEFTLREALADPHTEESSDLPSGPGLRNRVETLLSGLSSRERRVLELRYGLGEQRPETLDEVSQRMGVSRERIRQIQEQALRKLKMPSKKLNLAAFLPD